MIFTATIFLLNRSCTEIVLVAGSIAVMGPAIFRNEPDTISSAVNSPPSALRVPRARSWSPALISASAPGFASSNFTESGAYRRRMVSFEMRMTTSLFGPRAFVAIVIVPAAGSTLFTRPPRPCFCHSSRSCTCLSAMSAFFIATMDAAITDFLSSDRFPRISSRSPT